MTDLPQGTERDGKGLKGMFDGGVKELSDMLRLARDFIELGSPADAKQVVTMLDNVLSKHRMEV